VHQEEDWYRLKAD